MIVAWLNPVALRPDEAATTAAVKCCQCDGSSGDTATALGFYMENEFMGNMNLIYFSSSLASGAFHAKS